MKKTTTISIIIFGSVFALLALVIQYLEFRFYIGKLDASIYTGLVAAIFTVVGVTIGLNLLRKKTQAPILEASIDTHMRDGFGFNEREYQILQLIIKGYSNQTIADELFIALPTVKTHISNLYGKLQVNSRTQAIYKAQSLRIV